MNHISLSGHLTADIETREINGSQLAKFTLAHNHGEHVLFIPVEAWNMEHLPKHLSKGSHVVIGGSLKQDRWETDQGAKRSRLVLIARSVEFMSAAPTSSTQNASGHSSATPQRARESARRSDYRSRAA